MLRYEQAVGNSNNQPLELLKPKWVERVEIDRAKEPDGKMKEPEIVSHFGKIMDAKHLALLIATSSFKFTHIATFQRPQSVTIKNLHKFFKREHFIVGKIRDEQASRVKDELAALL